MGWGEVKRSYCYYLEIGSTKAVTIFSISFKELHGLGLDAIFLSFHSYAKVLEHL